MLGLFARQKASLPGLECVPEPPTRTGLFEQLQDEHHHCLDLLQRVEISLQQRKLARIPGQLQELESALDVHHRREMILFQSLDRLLQDRPLQLQRLRSQRRQRDMNQRRIRLFIEFYRPKATHGQYAAQFSFALEEVGRRLVRQFEEEETEIFPLSRGGAH